MVELSGVKYHDALMERKVAVCVDFVKQNACILALYKAIDYILAHRAA